MTKPEAQSVRPIAKSEPTQKEKSFWQLTLDAIPAFIMPVIIIGGIYGGFFSPTEAGAISALYALLIGTLLYRKLNASSLFRCFTGTGKSLGVLLVIMPMASIFTRIMIMQDFPA